MLDQQNKVSLVFTIFVFVEGDVAGKVHYFSRIGIFFLDCRQVYAIVEFGC
jgi:hypothetical protein